MEEIRFEWDEAKNNINKIKHGIDFEEAKTVFYDNNAIVFDDPDHSKTTKNETKIYNDYV